MQASRENRDASWAEKERYWTVLLLPQVMNNNMQCNCLTIAVLLQLEIDKALVPT